MYLQIIETFSTLHIVMEYGGQGTLQRRVMEEGPLSEGQARHTFAQLMSALNYMVSKERFLSSDGGSTVKPVHRDTNTYSANNNGPLHGKS